MYIGIFDHDLKTRKMSAIPNIDVMKISAYHKKRGDLVRFCFDATDLTKYSKIYLRKNVFNKWSMPDGLIGNPKVETGGLAFTNDIYVPMAPEIEDSIPDVGLYYNYCQKHLISKANAAWVRSRNVKILKSSPIRLSLDGKTIIPNYGKFISKDIVSVYDRILPLEAYDVLNEIGQSRKIMFTGDAIVPDLDTFVNYMTGGWLIGDNRNGLVCFYDSEEPTMERLKDISEHLQHTAKKGHLIVMDNSLPVRITPEEAIPHVIKAARTILRISSLQNPDFSHWSIINRKYPSWLRCTMNVFNRLTRSQHLDFTIFTVAQARKTIAGPRYLASLSPELDRLFHLNPKDYVGRIEEI